MKSKTLSAILFALSFLTIERSSAQIVHINNCPNAYKAILEGYTHSQAFRATVQQYQIGFSTDCRIESQGCNTKTGKLWVESVCSNGSTMVVSPRVSVSAGSYSYSTRTLEVEFQN